MDKRGFTVKEGAAYLGVSEWVMRVAIRENRIAVKRHGTTILIDRADLDAYFDGLPS